MNKIDEKILEQIKVILERNKKLKEEEEKTEREKQKQQEELIEAVKKGDLKEVQRLIDQHTDVNRKQRGKDSTDDCK